MVREFEDVPGDSMLLVLDPTLPSVPDAAALFEQAVSFAATVAREWCRGGADRLVLAVAGPEPVLLDGIAGPAFVQRALQHLADAVANGDATALLARIAALPNLPATAMVVSAGPGSLAGILGRQLRRPVTAIDATDSATLDYYDPPHPDSAVDDSIPARMVLHPLGS
jgi:uncharacterized protein (DUF58 family)